MKIHHKEINGTMIHSYNDSNIEWVVYCDKHSTQRFPKKGFSMRQAVDFYAEIMRIK